MDFGFLAYLGWREALVAAIALLALYILFAFLRINRLRDETRRVQELSPGAIQDAVSSYTAIQEPEPPVRMRTVTPEPAPPAKDREAFPWNEPPSESPDSRQIGMLEQELSQLRREVGGLRSEMQALREEQRREIGKVQATQHVSPLYSDAMQLAMQGREAADISALCGISRAEAELVVALAKSGEQAFD
jgi:hypothetical protein